MPRVIKCILLKLVMMILLLVLLRVCCCVPGACDPSRNPELDKSLVDDPRNREMDPATAKTIAPPAGRDLIRPSEVWKHEAGANVVPP